MADDASVTDWLLDSDPAIRWQVQRDLLGAQEPRWRAERATVETGGWGARLLSCADEDGQWAGGAFIPRGFEAREWHEVGQPWTATMHSLSLLREFGLEPSSDRAGRAVQLIGANSRWEEGEQPYWEGEVEECINGRTVADGAYFGVDVSPLVERLLGERLDDGGWNCERASGSVRSSFDTTINVLEGLLEHERATGGTPGSRAARASGEEYLLGRGLFRRLSTGEPADEQFLRFAHPNRWHYDVLRALDYFRSAGEAPDARLGDAIGHVRSRRLEDGTWPLDWSPPGRVWFEVDDGPGQPSRWITLRALRIAQEALVNAAKHAAGQDVAVRLDYGDSDVRLTVDNHVNPPRSDVMETVTTNGGYGLTGMRERLRLLDGTLVAGPRDDRWIVAAELPRGQAHEAVR